MDVNHARTTLDAICDACLDGARDEGFLYLTYRMLTRHMERHVGRVGFDRPDRITAMMWRFMASDLQAWRDPAAATAERALGLDPRAFRAAEIGVMGAQTFQMTVRTIYEHPVVLATQYTADELGELAGDYRRVDGLLSAFYDALAGRFARLYDIDRRLHPAPIDAERVAVRAAGGMKRSVFALRRRAWRVAMRLAAVDPRRREAARAAHARQSARWIRAAFNPMSRGTLRALKTLERGDTRRKLRILDERM